MASRKARTVRTAGSQAAKHNVSLAEALTKLGMTQEQFQAKQAELQTVLLQTQPFVPQNSTTRNLPTYEKVTYADDERSRSRSSSVSSFCSSRANSPAVPRTPVKAEGFPPRPRDQMELILEERNRRKELQRRASTSRPTDEERVFSTPGRGTDRLKTPNLPPDTPHHYKYYSERVVGVASSSKHTLDADDAPETPSRGRDRGQIRAPTPRYPKTPSRKQTYDSSCPATPRSSPPPEVNLVSSPGPMRPGPLENDNLPFALPGGPYSTAKPDLSYAAIIGRAIMASPIHALALQDIYEYITTVFPYYKRGETTWMNSVRHALSTMAVFRKVYRGRAEGKSLWAVLDCDVPCFEGGGFKKGLCADMNNGMSYRSRKRATEEAHGSRQKKQKTGHEPDSSIMQAPIIPPIFPHFASANSHTQSYYQAALQRQQVPADTLFPPLPPSSNYHRVVARTASIPILDPPIAPSLSDVSASEVAETDIEDDLVPSSPIERPPSSSSLPDLEFNLSSSSSPTLSSHPSLHGDSREPSPTLSSFVAPPTMELPNDDDAMAAWLRSDSPTLDSALQADRASSRLHTEKKQVLMMAPMGPPSSPTPGGKRASTARRSLDTTGSPDAKSTVESAAMSDAQPAVEHATGVLGRGRGPLLHPTLVVSALHAASNAYDSQHRPSTPERPVTPPRPPTSADLPSTPRLAQLESELFNFESPVPSHTRVIPKSPSLSVFNSRAPLLQMCSIEEFLAADPPPFPTRTPLGPPRTPKKSPIAAGSSSVLSFSAISPFGTPSRRGSRSGTGTSDLDEELARYLHTSPFNFNFSYDGVIAAVSSDTHAGSPGAPSW